MSDLSKKTIAVVDHGLFLPVAQKLSEKFGRVYYTTQTDRAFPTMKEVFGDGYGDVQYVEDLWDIKGECDGFVFPDIGFSGMQKELRSQGYPVWGGFDADDLESNRGLFLKTIAEIGLSVPQYEKVQGITRLRKYLRNKSDVWCKVSKWRGDIETFHWRDWEHDEGTLDYYSFKLGPMKEQVMFYCVEPIDTDIEDGIDTFCIDGMLPKMCLHGMEAKDKAYLGTMVPMKDIDERVRHVSETFAPVLKDYGYRGAFSTEVRIAGDASYFIDPTLRHGSPPSQVQSELVSNLAEIVWAGANGELVEPVPAAKFGGQVIIRGKGDIDQWTVAEIPDKIKQWVKIGSSCEVDGRVCVAPDGRCKDLGWLVAIDDTIEGVIEKLQERSAELPDGITADCTPIAELLSEMHAAEEQGMEITDEEIPEPETVLANGD